MERLRPAGAPDGTQSVRTATPKSLISLRVHEFPVIKSFATGNSENSRVCLVVGGAVGTDRLRTHWSADMVTP